MSLPEKLSRRIELFREEVEQWQDAHAEAMACIELQEALTFGLAKLAVDQNSRKHGQSAVSDR